MTHDTLLTPFHLINSWSSMNSVFLSLKLYETHSSLLLRHHLWVISDVIIPITLLRNILYLAHSGHFFIGNLHCDIDYNKYYKNFTFFSYIKYIFINLIQRHKSKLLANNYNRRIQDSRYRFRRALYHFGTLLILFDPKQIRCSHSYTPNYFRSMKNFIAEQNKNPLHRNRWPMAIFTCRCLWPI